MFGSIRKYFWVFLLLSGCAGASGFFQDMAKEKPRLIQNSYQAADKIHSQLRGSGAADFPMLVATFVRLDNFEATSQLGQLLAEQVASRPSQLGYSMVEVQLRSDQLAIRPGEGVFALSRNLPEINTDVEALSILVGTYSIIDRQIYVNTRVLRTEDGVALASADFSLPFIRQAKSKDAQSSTPQASVGVKLE